MENKKIKVSVVIPVYKAGCLQCSYDIKLVVGVEDGVARILEDFSYIPDIGLANLSL